MTDMTDIAKCDGQVPNSILPAVSEAWVCPVRETCWRYLAPTGPLQVYIMPGEPGKECPYYLPNEPTG